MRTSKNLKHIVQFVSTFSKYVEFYVILHNTLMEMTARVRDVFTKHNLLSHRLFSNLILNEDALMALYEVFKDSNRH